MLPPPSPSQPRPDCLNNSSNLSTQTPRTSEVEAQNIPRESNEHRMTAFRRFFRRGPNEISNNPYSYTGNGAFLTDESILTNVTISRQSGIESIVDASYRHPFHASRPTTPAIANPTTTIDPTITCAGEGEQVTRSSWRRIVLHDPIFWLSFIILTFGVVSTGTVFAILVRDKKAGEYLHPSPAMVAWLALNFVYILLGITGIVLVRFIGCDDEIWLTFDKQRGVSRTLKEREQQKATEENQRERAGPNRDAVADASPWVNPRYLLRDPFWKPLYPKDYVPRRYIRHRSRPFRAIEMGSVSDELVAVDNKSENFNESDIGLQVSVPTMAPSSGQNSEAEYNPYRFSGFSDVHSVAHYEQNTSAAAAATINTADDEQDEAEGQISSTSSSYSEEVVEEDQSMASPATSLSKLYGAIAATGPYDSRVSTEAKRDTALDEGDAVLDKENATFDEGSDTHAFGNTAFLDLNSGEGLDSVLGCTSDGEALSADMKGTSSDYEFGNTAFLNPNSGKGYFPVPENRPEGDALFADMNGSRNDYEFGNTAFIETGSAENEEERTFPPSQQMTLRSDLKASDTLISNINASDTSVSHVSTSTRSTLPSLAPVYISTPRIDNIVTNPSNLINARAFLPRAHPSSNNTLRNNTSSATTGNLSQRVLSNSSCVGLPVSSSYNDIPSKKQEDYVKKRSHGFEFLSGNRTRSMLSAAGETWEMKEMGKIGEVNECAKSTGEGKKSEDEDADENDDVKKDDGDKVDDEKSDDEKV